MLGEVELTRSTEKKKKRKKIGRAISLAQVALYGNFSHIRINFRDKLMSNFWRFCLFDGCRCKFTRMELRIVTHRAYELRREPPGVKYIRDFIDFQLRQKIVVQSERRGLGRVFAKSAKTGGIIVQG